jgi:hypothetical protein
MADEKETKVDYGAILADLEAKKAVLEQAITSFRAAMAAGALGVSEGTSYVNLGAALASPVGIPAGAFLGKNIPDAAKLYLSMVKQKKTSQEIAAALKEGGMESTSKNFEGMVHSILTRASKNYGEIVKVGRAWALAEWYPPAIRAAVSQENQKGRRPRRGRPRKNESKASVSSGEQQTPKPKERVLQALRNHQGIEMSLQELADHLRMPARAINMVLVGLEQQKVIQRTSNGKYRTAA